jgi:hypothetical protein
MAVNIELSLVIFATLAEVLKIITLCNSIKINLLGKD